MGLSLSRTSWAAIFVLATVGSSGLLIACTADDDDESFVADFDSGATFGSDDATINDSAAPTDDGSFGDGEALDGMAAPDGASDATPPVLRGIYAFNGYCGGAGAGALACPTTTACDGFDGGGIAAQVCPAAGTECIANAGDAGLVARVFDCVRSGQSVWTLNAICAAPYDDCSDASAAVTAISTCILDDAGVEGTLCVPSTKGAVTSCTTATDRYICQAGSDSTWLFNGYCDAGGTAACGTATAECTGPDAGDAASGSFSGGEVCATPFARCLSDHRVFVCAAH